MAWIKTIPLAQAEGRLLTLLQAQRDLYPPEYAEPVPSVDFVDGEPVPGIVEAHSLIPDALFHAFSALGVLLSPELPLSRRQQEMITTVVSVANRCHY